MSKDFKLNFLDSVADTLQRFTPQITAEVAYFIACQFALESNFGTSSIAKLNNNFCGMKSPLARISLNKGIHGFAKFDSFEACVLDYFFWLSYNGFTSNDLFNKDLFARKLIAKKYCPEKDYIDKIYNLFNSFKSIGYAKTK